MTEAGLKYTMRTGKEQNGIVDARPGFREEYFYTEVSGSVVEVKHETQEGGAVVARLLDRNFESLEALGRVPPGTTQELKAASEDDLLVVVHRA